MELVFNAENLINVWLMLIFWKLVFIHKDLKKRN